MFQNLPTIPSPPPRVAALVGFTIWAIEFLFFRKVVSAAAHVTGFAVVFASSLCLFVLGYRRARREADGARSGDRLLNLAGAAFSIGILIAYILQWITFYILHTAGRP